MSNYSEKEALKLLESDKFTLQQKYEMCLSLKQYDRAKKYLLELKKEQGE